MPDVDLLLRRGGWTLHVVGEGRRTRCGRRLSGSRRFPPGHQPPHGPVCRVCLRGLDLVADPDRAELACMHHARMVHALTAYVTALDGIRSDMIADGSHQQPLVITEHSDRLTVGTDFGYRGRRRRSWADPTFLAGQSRPRALNLSGFLADARPKVARYTVLDVDAGVSPW